MILHREVCKDTGLHSDYSDEAMSPEDGCLLGWAESAQRYFRLASGAKEPGFWTTGHTLISSNERK